MLTQLQMLAFRCFESLAVELAPGFNFVIGANGQGKTSILEAACVLLRLQSQRSATLAPAIRFGENAFGVAGRFADNELQFRYSTLRRKLALNGIEQRATDEYLRVCRVVSFANSDIELLRGSSEPRRRYLDFLGAQIIARYRPTLRAYERALRARNALLKSPQPRLKELAAYDQPLIEHGTELTAMRSELAAQLTPLVTAAHAAIGGETETLEVAFVPGQGADFAAELANSRARELRVRQTVVGPHRDDLDLAVNGKPAVQFASEGQQRTVALSLKIAQARLFEREDAAPPLLLIDDIFGELDPARRTALLENLPAASQKLVTATAMPARDLPAGKLFELRERKLTVL
jgi:DNA replication and repair protein RecF